jgi:hypothetical protein
MLYMIYDVICDIIYNYTKCNPFIIALIHYRAGEFQDAFKEVEKALRLFPQHTDSNELSSILMNMFATI